jgi:hypothetical protein
MPRAILEVLGMPEGYTDTEALAIIDAVYGAGILEAPARGGTAGGQIRITWAALVEKRIVAGVLAEEDT